MLALVLLLAANVAVALTPNEAAKADFATCLKTSKREKCVKQQELCAANLVRKEKDVKKYEKQLKKQLKKGPKKKLPKFKPSKVTDYDLCKFNFFTEHCEKHGWQPAGSPTWGKPGVCPKEGSAQNKKCLKCKQKYKRKCKQIKKKCAARL